MCATRCSPPAGAHLAADGVAYVSYDVFPGGHMREVTRQMLRWHLRDVDDPAERIAQARALLTAVSEAGQSQAEWALGQSDPALFHDELAEHHEAVLFTDFVDHAARHGLHFLAEADVFEMQAGGLPPGLGDDPIIREQYLDFFKGRMFRADPPLPRRERAPRTLAGGRARHAGRQPARPVGEIGPGRVEFRGPGGSTLTTDHDGVKAALAELGKAWPRALPVAELAGDEAVRDALLRAYTANLVQLHVWAPPLPAAVGERPVASALARVQAARGTHVTNLWHATVEVPDDLGRRLITLLDGTRDRAALLQEMQRPAAELERSLEGLRRIALLEAVE